jgi:CheY-like chemotaxis protein/HPt (histidine-containing phosphotransfer) domain-containing protein
MLDYKQLKSIRVLIAEDNPMNRIMVKRTMIKHDVQVTEVENGKDAIDKLKNKTFDIILMDIQMPIMDGIEATKAIRNKLNIETPIIALTGSSSLEHIEICLSAGMNAHVEKPFNTKALLQTILNLIHHTTSAVEIINKNEISTNNSNYDLSKLKEISSGNEAFVKKMIGLFIRTIPSSLLSMKKALNEQDYKTINAIAHRIKPSINDLGISQILSEIRQIEQLSLEMPDSKLLSQLIVKIEGVLNNVIDQLEKEIN